MAVVTIGRLSEEISRLLEGADPSATVSLNELKISIGQVVNSLIKAEHFEVNEKMGEKIPNGAALGTYENITPVSTTNRRSKATLPIKPLKLPRNMGIFQVFMSDYPDMEFIPLQMGQRGLLLSQPMINDVLGQVAYENYGIELHFNKDLPLLYPDKDLTMRLVVMDVSTLDDYDTLPISPEQEWQVKQEVWKLYSQKPIPDSLIDATIKENKNVPPKQQQQS